ncbi:hypothetical protein ACTXT7_007750 [Hymenolepis weldensis]
MKWAQMLGSLFEFQIVRTFAMFKQLVWILGLKSAPAVTTSASKSAEAQTTAAPMSLDASFFENSNTPVVSSQGGAVVSKVIAELPILSQTLSAIFEQTSLVIPTECWVINLLRA